MNKYWRHVGHKTLLSERAREYRKNTYWLIQTQTLPGILPFEGRVSVDILAMMPCRRKHDLDNILKPILDVLAYAGVYVDDSQIDRLSIRRGPVEPPGSLCVTVTAL